MLGVRHNRQLANRRTQCAPRLDLVDNGLSSLISQALDEYLNSDLDSWQDVSDFFTTGPAAESFSEGFYSLLATKAGSYLNEQSGGGVVGELIFVGLTKVVSDMALELFTGWEAP